MSNRHAVSSWRSFQIAVLAPLYIRWQDEPFPLALSIFPAVVHGCACMRKETERTFFSDPPKNRVMLKKAVKRWPKHRHRSNARNNWATKRTPQAQAFSSPQATPQGIEWRWQVSGRNGSRWTCPAYVRSTGRLSSTALRDKRWRENTRPKQVSQNVRAMRLFRIKIE